MMKFAEAFADAKEHARELYPEESCGLIVKGKYIRCDNIANHPSEHIPEDDDCTCRLCAFEIDPKVYLRYSRDIDVVVHSHPDGPYYPSKADMLHQEITGKEWAIIALDGERVAEKPVIWGGSEIPPVLGREFMHGVTDCYAVIKDVYALGKDELVKQGIEWPFDPITLPDCPRRDAWWEKGENLYIDNFERAGFIELRGAPEPGDVFLMKIRSSVENHGGVLIGNNLIVHHLPSRMSRREPAGLWGRQATRWLRYQGAPHA